MTGSANKKTQGGGPEDTIDSSGRVVIGGKVGSSPGTGVRPGTQPAANAGGDNGRGTVASYPTHITAPTPKPGSSTGSTTPTPAQQSAYALAQQTLASWDLSDLGPQVLQWIQQGVTGDELTLEIQQTPEYMQKYGNVNAARLAAGLPPMSAADQLSTKEQYRQLMQQAGLPAGFYDDDASLQQWLVGDVSPSEVSDRVQMASALVNSSPPEALQEFKNWYGGSSTGDVVAAILDPSAAEPVLQNKITAAQIGGAATAQGVNVSQQRAYQFAQSGVTYAQAQQAYQRIAQSGATDSAIASRFGSTFDQTDEENSLLLNDAAATQKRGLLYSEEQAQFGGHGAFSAASEDAGSNY